MHDYGSSSLYRFFCRELSFWGVKIILIPDKESTRAKPATGCLRERLPRPTAPPTGFKRLGAAALAGKYHQGGAVNAHFSTSLA
jgi:hypothetical protein